MKNFLFLFTTIFLILHTNPKCIAVEKFAANKYSDNFNKNVTTSSIVLENGLIAYYSFNGNANSEYEKANNGKLHGVASTKDRLGNDGMAYRFNGVNSYIEIDNIPEGLLGSVPKFIGCFIKVVGYPSGSTEMGIVYMGQDPPRNYGATHRFGINSSGKLGLNISHAFGFSSKISVPLNKWVYVYSYNNETNFFIGIIEDGAIRSERLSWTNWGASRSNLQPGKIWIGKTIPNGDGNGNYFNGEIDEISIYNRVLNDNETLELYKNSIDIGRNNDIPNDEISNLPTDKSEQVVTLEDIDKTTKELKLKLKENVIFDNDTTLWFRLSQCFGYFDFSPKTAKCKSVLVVFYENTHGLVYLQKLLDEHEFFYFAGKEQLVKTNKNGNDLFIYLYKDIKLSGVLYPLAVRMVNVAEVKKEEPE